MTHICIPYGRRHLEADIPTSLCNGIYEAPAPPPAPDGQAEVEQALDHPIGSLPLEDLAAGKRTATVIISDHTRPVPTRILLPPLLARLRQGAPNLSITLLVATGCHRATTPQELNVMMGKELAATERIIIHDADNPHTLRQIGKLPSGGDLILNTVALDCDLLIGTGFIEPHFFAGFSGGRKCILPGIASRKTVMANHCSAFIQSPSARTGCLEGNPIHQDMVSAARQAKLAFILNVVINSDKKILKAVAGSPEAAHKVGCDFINSFCRIKIPKADIVITSNGGYPLDQNVYQSVKGMTAGEAACRDGGVIIIAASCSDGHGGEAFRHVLAASSSPDQLLERLAHIPADETTPDQWQYQILARIQSRHTVIVVTTDCPHELLRSMHLEAASTLQEALDMAMERVGHQPRIAVIPDGVSVVVSSE